MLLTSQPMPAPQNADQQRAYEFIIIGTGFAGLAMGAQLKRRGQHDFVMLERASDVGGTWRDNHYPGAACDQPSHMYSLSFRLNPEWSSIFGTQPEIWRYLQQTAREEGLLSHIYFDTDVINAVWHETKKIWEIATSAGTYTARVLISAAGLLSEPKLPTIDGIETFEGSIFHSARWDHNVPLEGRNVAVIGTGASGVQIIPQVAKRAKHLTVFQRTPNWVTPRGDYQYSELEKGMFRREPQRLQALRVNMFWENEERFAARAAVPSLLEKATRVALAHLEAQIPDPVLRSRLTPNYAIGCKRILKSSDFYPALMRENVELITDRIERIDASAVITTGAIRHDIDALVLATGFEATEPPIANRIVGRDALRLDERWATGAVTYKTVAVNGFPNFFLLGGPNSGIGHNSQVYMFEAQIEHILAVLSHMGEHGVDAFEVSEQAVAAFTESLDRRAESSVWLTGGCDSWYVDERSGRVTTLWPDYSHSFQEEIPPLNGAAYRSV